MYASYFGLQREPFSIAPDPHYLFMSERHREALAHLLYGVGGGGGFVLLTGEIGTGKTTLCRLFLEQIPDTCNVAYIFNPKLTATELLQSVCEEFKVDVPGGREASGKELTDALNAFLLREHAAGRNNVLIIDEAQNLAPEVLEQLRLLTNLETRERKLLQVILIGQPELRDMLAQPQLEQLAQRVIARYHLGPLSEDETAQYIRHRLDVAGLERPFPFDEKAVRQVHRLSRGVPRRINLLCDRALLGAFAHSRGNVDARTVWEAAHEVFDDPAKPTRWHRPAFAVVALAVVGAGGFLLADRLARDDAATASAARTASAASAPASPASAPASGRAVVTSAAASAPSATVAPQLLADVNAAWRELAQLWKVDARDASNPCEALAARGLHCFNRPLNLALIRELDRPGIVTLDAASGAPRYAVLVALGRDSATLRAAGTEQTVTLAALSARWQGEFATLWHAPPGYEGRIPSRGETIDWMAARLATANKAAVPASGAVLDTALRGELRAFQMAHGLPPDGQPGPMTFMQLNRAGGSSEPHLRKEP